MSIKARKHLISTFTQLSPLIEKIPTLTIHNKSYIHPINAVSEIVIAQMLSTAAANTIKKRAYQLTKNKGYSLIGELQDDELRSAGLSANKTKAIKLLYEAYVLDPSRVNGWSRLAYCDLKKDLIVFFGISDWTISILSLFYFENPDVFPLKDGSINKVIRKLNAKDIYLEVSDAKPYRSYLALYLWAILDHGLLNENG